MIDCMFDVWFGSCLSDTGVLGAIEEAQYRRSTPWEMLPLLDFVPTGDNYWWPRLTIS